ncbi:MAG: alkaline phosphatase [Saprospiraceae bacterium]|nr:MAG: alkaline phosphatase [Saprospiraceae bacterium]
MRKLLYILLAASFLTSACNKNIQQLSKKNQPKNVILLIGDGMGLSQLSSSYYYKKSEPNFSRFKHIGLIRTYSSSHKITDSASSATAYSAGVKTYNGAIGVGPDTLPVETIVEVLAKRNWSTGLVVTSSITHATPASFFAHVKSRSMSEEIAAQFIDSPVNFLAGGGLKYFNNRSDQVNYLDKLKSKGFIVDTTGLAKSSSLNLQNKYAFLLAQDAMPTMQKGRADFLPNATQLAIDFLKQDKDGFFLMAEGSQIDWGGHANDGQYVITEVLDFDLAIGKALDFAKADGNTLVLVTADHETGGFTLASKTIKVPFKGDISDYDQFDESFSTGGHSATMVPIFAYGPGAENFTGVIENTAVFHKILKLLGVE